MSLNFVTSQNTFKRLRDRHENDQLKCGVGRGDLDVQPDGLRREKWFLSKQQPARFHTHRWNVGHGLLDFIQDVARLHRGEGLQIEELSVRNDE